MSQILSTRKFNKGELPKMEIMTDFIFGYVTEKGEIYHPTISELAEKYGCNESTIRVLSSKESWKSLKTAVQTRIKKTASKQEIAKVLSISSTLDARVLENVEKAHNITSRFLDRLENRIEEVDELDIREIDKIPSALQKVLQVMEKSALLARNLLGEDVRRETLLEDIEKIIEGTIEEFGYIEGITDINVLEDEIKKINAQRGRLEFNMEDVNLMDNIRTEKKQVKRKL